MSTNQPTFSHDSSNHRSYMRIYHVHYGPGYSVTAVLRDHLSALNGWRAVRLAPTPGNIGLYDTADKALRAIGVYPLED